MKVKIYSFSFLKNDINQARDEHGGGFVFDCRCLPNPGRVNKYKKLSGLDGEVIDWLSDKPEVEQFFGSVYSLVVPAVSNYIDRGFSSITVMFGCTGGQHRSVYLSEKLLTSLAKDFPEIKITIDHFQQPVWSQLK